MTEPVRRRRPTRGTPNLPIDKRERAIWLRAEGLTLQAIGAALGVCGERARQLLLPPPKRRCKGCGRDIDLPRVQYHAECRPPRRPRLSLSVATCRACGATFLRLGRRAVYCAPTCRAKTRPAGNKKKRGRKLADLRNLPFGCWTVLDAPPIRRGRHTRWKCRCRCGNEALVPADKLLAGTSTRCRRCAIGATWQRTCPTCGREYFGTPRQVYCSRTCRPGDP